jgi:AraC-like DNA-binding protein
MPKTISRAIEQRILRSSLFRQTLQDVHHMTGLEVLYIGSLGKEKLRTPREPTTALRQLDHQIPPLAALRQETRQAMLIEASPVKALPWREVIHPIRIEQEPIGYLAISAWRPQGESLESLRDLWLSWARSGLGVTWKTLEELWQSLPTADDQQILAWRRHLKLITDDAIRKLEYPNAPELLPDHLPPMIQQACDHIRKSFRSPVTLTETARTCGVSPEHLSRRFHQSTGLRFNEYLTETRIQEVCTDLTSTSDPIGDIAERNGFSTLSRFNRAFRESTGFTPREWRKRQFRKQKR